MSTEIRFDGWTLKSWEGDFGPMLFGPNDDWCIEVSDDLKGNVELELTANCGESGRNVAFAPMAAVNALLEAHKVFVAALIARPK